VLLTARDRVVEKTELMKLVWPDSFVGEDSLTHNIATLRKALGDVPDRPQYIVTVPRHGYRFVAPVRVVLDEVAVAAMSKISRQHQPLHPNERRSTYQLNPAPPHPRLRWPIGGRQRSGLAAR
jgi:DNA-binding winged helix-turn-helix (wHTH) protein